MKIQNYFRNLIRRIIYMLEVKNLSELSTKVSEEKDIILLITQDDCFKCTVLKNAIPEFVNTGAVTKPVYYLNLDHEGVDREQAKELFDIMSTPVLVGYKDGKRSSTFSGAVTPMQLMELEKL